MKVNVSKDFYEKMTTKDGVHYELEEGKEKVFYHLKIEEDYEDIQSRNQLINEIQTDLEGLVEDLEKMKEGEKER